MTIIVIAILTGLCFASLLYISNKSQHYGKALTTLLFILRSIAIGLLVLLFFNPFIKKKSTKIEAATVIIAQDNSNSLILTKDSTFYKEKYPLLLDSVITELEKNFIVDKYLFGNEVKDFTSIDYKDYYTDLTGIAREYLEGQFNIDAIEMTSDEILDEVRKIQLDNLIFSKLQNTLITSDLVKFAKAIPSPAENENAFKDINSFIEESFVFYQEQEKKKAEEAKAKKYDFEEDKNQEMEETK